MICDSAIMSGFGSLKSCLKKLSMTMSFFASFESVELEKFFESLEKKEKADF